MKHIISLLAILFLTCCFSFAQEKPETTSPFFGTTVNRELSIVYIEDVSSSDVSLVAIPKGNIKKGTVQVIVKSKNLPNKKKYYLYNHVFNNAFLYCFKDGSIKVGYGNAMTYVSVYKDINGIWGGRIQEKGIMP